MFLYQLLEKYKYGSFVNQIRLLLLINVLLFHTVVKTIFSSKFKFLKTACLSSNMKTRSQKNRKIYSLQLHQLIKRPKRLRKITNLIGSRNMVTGVKTVPRTTKSTATDVQQEQK